MWRLILALTVAAQVPNSRDQEINRDFTNSLQFGFAQGLLKVSQSGSSDCVDAGMSLARDTKAVWGKYLHTFETMDLMNAVQFTTILETRCNYWATLEGVVMGHKLRTHLKQTDHTGFGKILSAMILASEMGWNVVDDALVISTALMSFSTHGGDLFDFGVILGKATKMIVQYYLEGILFRKYRDYDLI